MLRSGLQGANTELCSEDTSYPLRRTNIFNEKMENKHIIKYNVIVNVKMEYTQEASIVNETSN